MCDFSDIFFRRENLMSGMLLIVFIEIFFNTLQFYGYFILASAIGMPRLM